MCVVCILCVTLCVMLCAKLEEAKRGISGGIDLMEVKREEKIARETQLNNTFKDIALEWHSNKL